MIKNDIIDLNEYKKKKEQKRKEEIIKQIKKEVIKLNICKE